MNSLSSRCVENGDNIEIAIKTCVRRKNWKINARP